MINDSLRVKIAISRSRHDPAGYVRWKIGLPQCTDFVIAAQLSDTNLEVECYYLFPKCEFDQAVIMMQSERPDEFARYRFTSLPALFGLPA